MVTNKFDKDKITPFQTDFTSCWLHGKHFQSLGGTIVCVAGGTATTEEIKLVEDYFENTRQQSMKK